tara:strand:+ start:612 stop:812 length:201 start_codon:yes stop_codon:yes gene_type:complete
MEKIPKDIATLDIQIARLKGIVNMLKMSEITESHSFAIKIITTLSMIITKMEVPELISDGKTQIEA